MLDDAYIGLMSGTSLDGVDGVLMVWPDGRASPRVIASASLAFPAALRLAFLELNQPGENELHRAAQAAHALTSLYADLVQELLQQAGVSPADVRAIGAHGQTVRHQPPGTASAAPYTIQLNQPALLAERCGITVVADFRSRDIAAGGQGAPLVPAFHRHIFGRTGHSVAVVNIGGMANITALPASGPVRGLDTGPGNVLMDLWCHRHTGAWFDDDGRWAASGTVDASLLAHLLQTPYFHQKGVKSTGRDLFHAAWLDTLLQDHAHLAPADVQATLTALTARTIADTLCAWDWEGSPLSQVWVCGGGSRNTTLMRMLSQALPQVPVQASDAAGWPAHWVEPAAFAWLARQTILGLPGNLPSVTGAAGPRVLGAIYPA
ncbi:anhydro-N-acetylmuramic acid kinase [Tepidicella baoligensis]|uniref:anhydro-N-acetylmuramic acid kinase n=1 Tax=Tepidicella baoligensis TaxID=2707016 RepID=UPI0015D9DABF|nr:anhydro-N-acetylmuramic acid kinase [Tepidicella baoligensis]